MLATLILLVGISNPDSLYATGDRFYFNYNYDSAAWYYAAAAVKYLDNGNSRMAATSYSDLGLCFQKLGLYDRAIKHYKTAISIDEKHGNWKEKLQHMRNLANTYRSAGMYSQAIEVLNQGLMLSKELADNKNVGALHTTLGNVFYDFEDYEKSLKAYQMALEIYQERNDSARIALALHNIGTALVKTNDFAKAIKFFHISISVSEYIDDLSNAGRSHHSLGELKFAAGAYDSAKWHLIRSLKIRQEIGEGANLISSALSLARLHLSIDSIDRADEYLELVSQLFEETGSQNLHLDFLNLKASLEKNKGNYAWAYNLLQEWADLRDSVFNQQKLQVQKLQSEYELERSESAKELAELESELAKGNAQSSARIAWFIGLCFLLGTGFTLVIYRQRKSLRQLNHALVQSNREIDIMNKQNVHFTKNSLSSIVALLGSQMKSVDDNNASELILEQRLRMESINVLYNQLFINDADSKVNLSAYLIRVVQNTQEGMMGFDSDFKTEFNLENIEISNEKAVSIGLIVNEVCINTFKYAIPQAKVLSMNLSESDYGISLTIGDNGRGIPDGSSEGFGSHLIATLTQELGGKMHVDNSSQGLYYYFDIPTSDR